MHIKTIFKLAGIVSALQASAFAQANTDYNYSYIFSSGDIISGTFTGTPNGNLITNLSNITAKADGIEFNFDANGSLYGFSFTPDITQNLAGKFSFTTNTAGALTPKPTWIDGGAVASFDGKQNNFLFIDSPHPDNNDFSNFFAIGNAFGGYSSAVQIAGNEIKTHEPFNPAKWSVAEVLPTPVPAAVWLFGSVLMGWIGVNKRRQQVPG